MIDSKMGLVVTGFRSALTVSACVLALGGAAVGCCMGGGTTTTTEPSLADPVAEGTTAEAPAADGLTPVPNSAGLRARVPEGVTPNGIGGAAGFHTDDDSFSMMLNPSTGTIAEAHETATMLGSVRSVRDEETPDGFVFVWEGRRLDDQMQPTETPVFHVDIKRDIAGTAYSCTGTSSTEEGATHIVEACQSVVGG